MNTLPERFDSFSASKGAVDCRKSIKEHHYCLRLWYKVGSASPCPWTLACSLEGGSRCCSAAGGWASTWNFVQPPTEAAHEEWGQQAGGPSCPGLVQEQPRGLHISADRARFWAICPYKPCAVPGPRQGGLSKILCCSVNCTQGGCLLWCIESQLYPGFAKVCQASDIDVQGGNKEEKDVARELLKMTRMQLHKDMYLIACLDLILS